MPEVRNFAQGAAGKQQNQPGMFQLTCSCRRILVVQMGTANCPTCERVYQISITDRPMTPAEQRVAAAHLRGERLPIEEPTVTQKEGLR